MSERKRAPIIMVGRFAGTPIDQLPNSYLRWMMTQSFPKDWLDCARNKLKQSEYNDLFLNVSRHAIDMFSKRFMHLWNHHIRELGDEGHGLATFIAKLAQVAWDEGIDVSKRRHQKDGVVRELDGIKWVFGVNPDFPEYRDVITVIPGEE